jgi:hypothetical protein
MRVLHSILLLLTAAILFIGCDDTITANDIDNREIPDSNVSYSIDIAPIFELKCVSCHRNGREEGDVNLSTWAGVVNPIIVIPGEAETSPLVWGIEWRPGFPPMPPQNSSFLPLTLKQITGVKTWIDEGAKNN